jgi:hypothetical protein
LIRFPAKTTAAKILERMQPLYDDVLSTTVFQRKALPKHDLRNAELSSYIDLVNVCSSLL